jgi:hypothetical protein
MRHVIRFVGAALLLAALAWLLAQSRSARPLSTAQMEVRLEESLAALASSRVVTSVRVIDGRPAGRLEAIIGYQTVEVTDGGYIAEWVDLLRAAAVSVRSNRLDLDTVTLVGGDANGNAAGTMTVGVPDLLAFYEGRLSQRALLDLAVIVRF